MSHNTMIFLSSKFPCCLLHMYRVATYYSNSPPVNYIQCEFHLHLKIYHFQIDISIFNISQVFHFHSTFQPSSTFSIPEQYCCLKEDMYTMFDEICIEDSNKQQVRQYLEKVLVTLNIFRM